MPAHVGDPNFAFGFATSRLAGLLAAQLSQRQARSLHH